MEAVGGEKEYTIPFYTDSSRSVLLGLLPIKVEGGIDKKIIAGAALIVKSWYQSSLSF